MNTSILHAECLKAYLAGELVEFKRLPKKESGWIDFNSDSHSLALFDDHKHDFRIKPRAIKIGEYEIAPVRNEPQRTSYFYTPCLDAECLYKSHNWYGGNSAWDYLRKGLVHLNKEEAIRHAKALLSLTQYN